jgi:hypothetical protein
LKKPLFDTHGTVKMMLGTPGYSRLYLSASERQLSEVSKVRRKDAKDVGRPTKPTGMAERGVGGEAIPLASEQAMETSAEEMVPIPCGWFP